MKYLDLFACPVQITEQKLDIDSLIDFSYEMKDKDPEGVHQTNIGGWQSKDIINEKHPEFVKLKNKIEEAQKLRDAGMKAHEDGNHSESEKLLNQALQLFKS